MLYHKALYNQSTHKVQCGPFVWHYGLWNLMKKVDVCTVNLHWNSELKDTFVTNEKLWQCKICNMYFSLGYVVGICWLLAVE